MSYPASLIASAFVRKGIDAGSYVTQMKLQKMVFFAHGYHLARYNEPLIKEHFQAWKFGPVVPEIYQYYKLYGSKPITDTMYVNNLPDDSDLDERANDAIEYTWEVTKGLSAATLSNWTHNKNSPWDNTYNPLDWENDIDNKAIKEYFKGFLLTINNE